MCKGGLESAQALSDLVNDLLDVTRIRTGKMALDRREMDLRQEVLETVSRASEAAKDRGSRSTVHADLPVMGHWDRMRIGQVAENLLSNAIKYGEGKEISISVSEDRGRGLALLRVQDQGIGISRDMQRKIFERFQRAVSSTKITGLGLGLYIVRQIVEGHGGSIRVESQPEQGSLFTVELPTSVSEVAK
jgi:signal transduction histidine kinase